MKGETTTPGREAGAPLPPKADQPRRDANWCVALGLGTVILAYTTTEIILSIRYDLLTSGWFVLLYAQWGASIVYGLVALLGALDERSTNRGVVRALCGLVLSGGCVLLLTGSLAHDARFRVRKPNCQNNLKQWAVACNVYASEAADKFWPPLDGAGGNLSVTFSTLNPDYIPAPEAFWQCPETPASRIAADPAWDIFPALADDSYFYLGYIIDSPATLKAFEAAYRKVIAEDGDFTHNLPVESGQGTWGGDVILRLSGDPNVLEPGIPQELASDPYAIARVYNEVPVLIERPGHHRGNAGTNVCNVVYMSGNVQALPFPGAWPLTAEFMATLNRLDALGPKLEVRSESLFRSLFRIPAPITSLALCFCLFAATRCRKQRRLRTALVYFIFIAGWLTLNGFRAPDPAMVRVDHPDGVITYLPARPQSGSPQENGDVAGPGAARAAQPRHDIEGSHDDLFARQ